MKLPKKVQCLTQIFHLCEESICEAEYLLCVRDAIMRLYRVNMGIEWTISESREKKNHQLIVAISIISHTEAVLTHTLTQRRVQIEKQTNQIE